MKVRPIKPKKREGMKHMIVVIIAILCLFFTLYNLRQVNSDQVCQISFGKYHGNQYRSPETVGDTKCLVESKWMQVMQVSPGGKDYHVTLLRDC